MEVQGKQAVVAFGMIKSTVKLEQLEKVSKGQIKKEIQKSTFVSVQTAEDMHEKKLNFKQEIDVRGMRGDEALQAECYNCLLSLNFHNGSGRYLLCGRCHTGWCRSHPYSARDRDRHTSAADTRLPAHCSGRPPVSRRTCPIRRCGYYGCRTRIRTNRYEAKRICTSTQA